MKLLSIFGATALVAYAFSATAAEPATMKNPVSVHVLNLQTGIPTAGVSVELDQNLNGKWITLATGVTDASGRISALYPAGKQAEQGTYKVVFKTGDYYASVKQKTFFPEIPVIFTLDNTSQHYHIPLLLSPYGYSTYRGN
ncbi:MULTISPECIES: hydroxyisourate hydrolase [Pantoea]|jgi:5-hydroxyisourate hydrolase|uniref:hydroxyisourate hydrolase n=1 Tax=Pantoea TaxID=53335 RepID=UPI000EA09A74|nr:MULTISPECIES: hydroxyisourate hydrolase [Pantoea]MDU6431879.1 hydroxyisourate hydrolase [Pantoea sp.]MBZ6387524.1 hydroxyisourate hydrolase [Pantoea piersonii]MBZ6402059.1 hydroxyisourate hydrolase [Pantoea piersonii]MBZ6408797.1 hydroxyisourate hydrolase [Pantoea piersonii]MBZ6428863.1 hydroxyisourate hydrolase [Pantoea piersonii]